MSAPEEITEKLNENVLAEAEKKAALALNRAIAPERPAEEDEEGDVSEEHPFFIDHESPDGKRRAGNFRSRVMSIGDQIKVGIIRAGLCGGVPPSMLDESTLDLTEMVATLQVVLIEKPDWFADVLGERDIALLTKVFEEVASHEAKFQQRRSSQSQKTR